MLLDTLTMAIFGLAPDFCVLVCVPSSAIFVYNGIGRLRKLYTKSSEKNIYGIEPGMGYFYL